MFKVETRTSSELYCPNGHEQPPGDHSVNFCHICGEPIPQLTYDAALCARCNNPVSPEWNFCPYCGQGRDDRG